ncbi:TetR/AcrR family transcriptional regulator [Streptosporangium sp. NPDC048865]|uniref:TetR/AcrR family transcriptional regulator n=1 Tax=Streptosporangium sp. NPDC048865 TaxID=3155766 RepID=UPI0034358E37
MTPTNRAPGGTDGPGDAKPLRADAQRNRERILAAAEAVFAEKGPAASTEEVAARAGVAIGTVFKHFPTKQALLQAIMKGLLGRLDEEMAELAAADAPGEALFTFVTRMVEQAARKRTVVGLLAETGVDLQVASSVRMLREGIETLLARSQEAGTVREDVRLDEVIALLTGVCQGALHAGWDEDLQRRTLAIVFAGLRAPRGADD